MQRVREIAEQEQAAAPAQLVHAGVGGDAVEPGGELRVAAKGRSRSEQLHEHLLGCVPGRLVVALEKAMGDRVDAVPIALEQLPLGIRVAPAEAFQEIGVARRLNHPWHPHAQT